MTEEYSYSEQQQQLFKDAMEYLHNAVFHKSLGNASFLSPYPPNTSSYPLKQILWNGIKEISDTNQLIKISDNTSFWNSDRFEKRRAALKTYFPEVYPKAMDWLRDQLDNTPPKVKGDQLVDPLLETKEHVSHQLNNTPPQVKDDTQLLEEDHLLETKKLDTHRLRNSVIASMLLITGLVIVDVTTNDLAVSKAIFKTDVNGVPSCLYIGVGVIVALALLGFIYHRNNTKGATDSPRAEFCC